MGRNAMIYQQLFHQVKDPPVVRAGLIGCGNFGSALFTQGRFIPRLELKVVCDVKVEAARKAFRLAGVPEADIAVCDTAGQALWAMEAGKWVIVEDAMNLRSLPLHVIATATIDQGRAKGNHHHRTHDGTASGFGDVVPSPKTG